MFKIIISYGLKCRCPLKFLQEHGRFLSINSQTQTKSNPDKSSELTHCYKCLFPWRNFTEFSDNLISSIVYNKDGLIAVNKPFGIKVHCYDKSGTPKTIQRHITTEIPNCNFTIEDALPDLKAHLKVPNLIVLKSLERFSSGIILLSTNEKVSAAVKKSFNTAKHQKRPHFIYWMLTLGYPVLNFKQERVGIQLIEDENINSKQPVILTEFSKRACKRNLVSSVRVEYRALSVNKLLKSSLVEISTSSERHHFVKVYASSRVASILGDVMYSNRINTLLGVPIKLYIEQSLAFDLPPLPDTMANALCLPKGVKGHSMVPTMLHLKSILLPSFNKEDLIITAEPPYHFQWTAEKLKLLFCTNT